MKHTTRDALRCARISDRGVVLIVALGLLIVCALWGMKSLIAGPSEVRTAENYRHIAAYYAAGQQAFYAAEAGVEEARARLRLYPGTAHRVDQEPDNPAWQMSIGQHSDADDPDIDQASDDPAASPPQALTYAVTIRHATPPAAATVLRWGDVHGEGLYRRNTSQGEPIYVITAQGAHGEAKRTVEIEAAPEPPPTVPAALYTAGPLRLQNPRTYVSGMDSCGEQHRPGLRTPLSPPLVGSPPAQAIDATTVSYGQATITGTPAMVYHSPHVQVQALVERLQERAEILYTPALRGETQTEAAVQWGSPQRGVTFQTPSVCAERQVIVYKTPGAPGSLSPGSAGCGVLLVQGDLLIQGDFSWYGAILVTGAVHLTGGGSKHITGGLMAGGGLSIDDDGGDTSVIYCSEAIAQQTRYMPLRVLAWREVSSTAY